MIIRNIGMMTNFMNTITGTVVKDKSLSSSCLRCPSPVCDRLRAAVARSGAYAVVSDRPALYASCPFAVRTAEEFVRFCRSLMQSELFCFFQQVSDSIPAAIRAHGGAGRHVTTCNDSAAYVRLLLAFWDLGAFAVLRVPENAAASHQIRSWLDSRTSGDSAAEASGNILMQEPDEAPALTDALIAAQEPGAVAGSSVVSERAVTNPRWEHVDKDRAAVRPDGACGGDVIALIADVSGMKDGTAVEFDIFDAGQEPVMRICTETARVNGGVARVEYKVADTLSAGEEGRQLLAFTASSGGAATGRCSIPILLSVPFVEIADVHFNIGSAVPCLDETGELVGALIAALQYAAENPEVEAVVFGHTDTSGRVSDNYALSKLRARAVKALLDGDGLGFGAVAVEKSSVADYQMILKTLARAYGWLGCDPGAVDDIYGPKTNQAVSQFQKSYNKRFEQKLLVDGLVGPKTWAAFGRVACAIIKDAYGKKNNGAQPPRITWGNRGEGVYACGESFPVDNEHVDGYRSRVNRRVEIAFFERGKAPKLEAAPDKNKRLTAAQCPVYRTASITKSVIAVTAIAPLPQPAQKSSPVRATCVIDSHMHIQSGNTAPLPLLRRQLGTAEILLGDDRTEINLRARTIMNAVLGQLGKIQDKDCDTIGGYVLEDNARTYASRGSIAGDTLYSAPQASIGATAPADATSTPASRNLPPAPQAVNALFTPMVVMTMDMEYAHIAGFSGSTIYHEDRQGKYYYYHRRSAFEPEEKGEKKYFEAAEKDLFIPWRRQLAQTIAAVKGNPWKLLPMYHYEPRRWRFAAGHAFDGRRFEGAWDYPFGMVAGGQRGQKGIFLGFKMYPRLGYMPLDHRCPHLADFYKKCAGRDIPIVTHCAPGGLTTHEDKFYKEFDVRGAVRTAGMSSSPADATAVADTVEPYEYFERTYGHPEGWRPVLMQVRNLRLCLAHFGGDLWSRAPGDFWIEEIVSLMREFPNVYTDISCFNIQKCGTAFERFLRDEAHSDLKSKILFGTDWYLTMAVMMGKGYARFCEEFKQFLDRIDPLLWLRFTLINPFEFYGLGNKERLANLEQGLADEGAAQKPRQEGYEKMLALGDEVAKLRREYKI